ncbi:MAG: hypothetical protein IPF84_11850 [Proteobacteria bacterium]|nr:hypothetical protein [Pseudomonadota bacterium]
MLSEFAAARACGRRRGRRLRRSRRRTRRGTGAITSALLARGLPPDRLIVVERDPILARHLRETFRGVSVIRGDAVELARLLAHDEGGGPPPPWSRACR